MSKKAVFIVEDEELIRSSLVEYLSELEYEVTGFCNGEEALLALSNGKKCDVAIVDLRMPGINGEEFAIKANGLCPEVKFILQTGSIDYEPSEELEKIGVSSEHVLIKPVFSLRTYSDSIEKFA